MKTALVLFVLVFTLIAGVEGQHAEFDLLIRNGRILDGTGNPSFVNDVGLRDGKIAAIGALSNARAARVIDANGLAVAPGFIIRKRILHPTFRKFTPVGHHDLSRIL